MDVQDKYLPTVAERELFLRNKIEAYKGQIYGGTIEVAQANASGEKRNAEVQEDMQKQLIKSVDVLVEELDKLGE